jgi:hypothetical protein
MNVTLESIQFRIPGADNGAFNISVAVEGTDDRRMVTGPEWQEGEQPQPAAFAPRGAPPFIDVTLLCSEAGPVQACLQATAGNAHVLGDIAPLDIVFQNGQPCRITLAAARLGSVGKHAIQWHWQVVTGLQSFEFDSEHDIYTVVGDPSDPWEAAGSDPSAAPWKEALDAACNWADGAANSVGALTAITDHHYRSGLLRYGSMTYTDVDNGIFKIEKFLTDQSQGGVNDVNCSDCASIGATFGKLLGATCLTAKLLTEPVVAFLPANTNVFVGGEAGPGPGFDHHEAIWDTQKVAVANVWDFCLGRNSDGVAGPYTDIVFAKQTQEVTTYPALAFIPVTAQNLTPASFPMRQVRDTAPVIALQQPADPTRFGFDSWINSTRDFKGLAFLNFVPQKLRAVDPLKTYRYRKQPKPWLAENVYRFGDETVQISVFECESRQDAHLALFQLLAARQAMPVLKLDAEPIGDVLFYDEDKTSDMLLFGRGNLAIRIQRNRGSLRSLLELAQLTDSLLTQGLTEVGNVTSTTADAVHEMSLSIPQNTGEFVRLFSETTEIVISGVTATVQNGTGGIHTVAVDHHLADSVRRTVVNFLHESS